MRRRVEGGLFPKPAPFFLAQRYGDGADLQRGHQHEIDRADWPMPDARAQRQRTICSTRLEFAAACT